MSGIPKYLLIANDLKAKIENGIYSSGSFLPPETELQNFYEVSRPTIRQAIARLKDLNMIRVLHGKGTQVHNRHYEQYVGEVRSFTDSIKLQDAVPGTKVLSTANVRAEQFILDEFHLPPGSELYRIERLRYANEFVVSYHTSYLRPEHRIDAEKLEQTLSLYDYLQSQYHLRISFSDESIMATSAGKEIASMIGVKENASILYVVRTAFSADNEMIEYSFSYIRSDLFKYRIRVYQSE